MNLFDLTQAAPSVDPLINPDPGPGEQGRMTVKNHGCFQTLRHIEEEADDEQDSFERLTAYNRCMGIHSPECFDLVDVMERAEARRNAWFAAY